MLWTEEAIETLKTLALQGRSARAIAEALGAPSRSAVIGKANRVGIKLSGGAAAGTDRQRAPSSPRATALCERGPKAASSRRALVHALPREPRRQQWIFAEAEVGEMLRLGLEEIAEANCRWPLGDPMSEDFAYCGLPPARGRSYCAGHCRLAYQAAEGGRKIAMGSRASPLRRGGAAIRCVPSAAGERPGADRSRRAMRPCGRAPRSTHPSGFAAHFSRKPREGRTPICRERAR